jgi:D-inositol-3-phosphate glycosyltransferase
MPPHRIAFLSVHTCPLAKLGGKETGGMNVAIKALSQELGRLGVQIDIFTRLTHPSIPKIVSFAPNVRVIHVAAGPVELIDKYEAARYLERFEAGVETFRKAEGIVYDLIHSHYWLSGFVGVRLKKLWRKPLIHTYHTVGLLKNAVNEVVQMADKPIRLQIEQEILSDIDGIITANPDEKRFLAEVFHYEPDRIDILPLGVDLSLFLPTDREEAKERIGFPNDKIILYVGRVDPVKGIDYLIKALKTAFIPVSWKCLIVGGRSDELSDDLYMASINNLIESLALRDSVVFIGAKPQHELPLYYSAADVCVIPSLYESFGLVALEAAACETPAIVTDRGGLTTIVRHGETGYIGSAKDVEGPARQIRQITADENLRRRLGKRARRLALRFGWEAIGQMYLESYHAFINGKR